MEKLGFKTYTACIERDGEAPEIRIVRAETREELTQVTVLEGEHFFEEKEGDCGYIYELDEVFELQEFGEFFLVYAAQELIGYTSIAFGPEANPKIPTQENDAYYAGSVLKPEWRRKGLSRHMNAVREARALLYNAQQILTCLVPNNVTSLSALSKAGFVISDAVESVFSGNDVVNGDRLVMSKSLLDQDLDLEGEGHELGISLDSAPGVFAAVSKLIENQRRIFRQHVQGDVLYLEYV